MTSSNITFMLFGAMLCAIGVLASALADRVRGIYRANREAHPEWSEWVEEPVAAPRARRPRATKAADTIFVPDEPLRAVDPVELIHTKPASLRRAPRSESKAAEGAEDVIAALVAAGYKKAIATEAAWGCGPAERSSVEEWTRAALRSCAKGGVS